MARINTNIPSLVARSNLARTNADLTTRLQRLSTGLRINRGADDPAGLIEVIDLALETGAPLFVCHITHNAMGGISDWLAMIDSAKAKGARIATETLS